MTKIKRLTEFNIKLNECVKSSFKEEECINEIKDKYKVCSEAAIEYIKASEEVKDILADVALDMSVFDEQSSKNLESFIKKIKEDGYYCNVVSKTKASEFPDRDYSQFTVKNENVHSVYSLIMHNGAYKKLKDRMYNSGLQVFSGERAVFLHFDINVAKKHNEVDLDAFSERLNLSANKTEKVLGISPLLGENAISAMHMTLKIKDCPDIQFRELLVDYFDEISKKSNRPSGLLVDRPKKLDLLDISKNGIKKTKRVNRPI